MLPGIFLVVKYFCQLTDDISGLVTDNHFLIFCLSICDSLLDNHKERTNEPVETNSSRKLKCKNSSHSREDIYHHLLHLLHVRHIWIFWLFFFFWLVGFDFFLREPHLTELKTTSEHTEDDTDDTTTLLELETEKVRTNRDISESLQPIYMIEVGEISWIADVQNHLVEDDKNRDLYEDRQTRAERVHSFFFVELHHLHADGCLIAFMFFLNSLYFWLNHLHSTLRNEHLLLRYEECKTDDESNSDNSPTETVPRKYENQGRKEIVNRVIKECPEKESKDSCMSDGESCFRSIFCFWLSIGESERDVGDIGKAFLKLEDIFF